ncbi:MAG TPA: histidine kinase [Bryobacteraceae bacterium]|nr:histidine kinase [Bryobacteraceae bacterium]
MKNYKRWLGYLLANCAAALLAPILLFALGNRVSASRLWETFRYALVYANCIGVLSELSLPRLWLLVCGFRPWVRWTLAFTAMFAAAVVGSMISGLVLVMFGWLKPDVYWIEFSGSVKIAIFITFVTGGTISLYESMRARLDETTLQLRTKELERERALKLATEAQLASLESRIHPHFLFNTLNSISSLIPEDPARAERLIEQMAALLRFSLDANQAGLVPLASELKIVADYLEIERARFGDRLRYRMDISGDLEGTRVPPLSVQTLVENSVKFAIAPSRAGGEICIAGARDNGQLRLEVSDEGPAFTLESSPKGHGLDNLKGRLATLYGDHAALTLQRRDNRNNLTLSIPQNGNGYPSISG